MHVVNKSSIIGSNLENGMTVNEIILVDLERHEVALARSGSMIAPMLEDLHGGEGSVTKQEGFSIWDIEWTDSLHNKHYGTARAIDGRVYGEMP